MRAASCPCGQLKVAVEAEPVFVTACNCTLCQKRSGSPFSTNARFPAEAARIEGDYRTYERSSDSGRAARQNFCPVCGVTVFTDIDAMPGLIGVPVGCFADPSFPPPTIVAWCEAKHPWVVFPESAHLMDRQ